MDSGRIKLKKILIILTGCAVIPSIIFTALIYDIPEHWGSALGIGMELVTILPVCALASFIFSFIWIKDSITGKLIYGLLSLVFAIPIFMIIGLILLTLLDNWAEFNSVIP